MGAVLPARLALVLGDRHPVATGHLVVFKVSGFPGSRPCSPLVRATCPRGAAPRSGLRLGPWLAIGLLGRLSSAVVALSLMRYLRYLCVRGAVPTVMG